MKELKGKVYRIYIIDCVIFPFHRQESSKPKFLPMKKGENY